MHSLLRLALLLAACSAFGAAGPAKPNLVLILADDLGYGSVGCYGGNTLATPHLDRLAEGGVRLTDFHSNGAMCTPTRAALLTGRYQQRCAWVPDEELTPLSRSQRAENPRQRWAWGISRRELTLPALLGQAGYRSALIGKWHLGYDPKFHPMDHGFDEFRGFVGGGVDYHTHVATHGSRETDWWVDRALHNSPGYTTDLLTRHATDFITRHKDHPFLLYLAHAAPHTPWQGRDTKAKKSPAETYREMIAVLDESVGAVMETLRKNGLERNTLVVFCSDNGPQAPAGFPANGPLRGAKGSMSEGGHRVPFIAHWPGVIPAGTTSGETILSMDLLPTFAKLAGAAPPQGHVLDGVDVLPVLKGETKVPERTLHWLFGNDWAVRQGPWKLIGKGREAITLVNLENDLSESANRIAEKPELAAELLKLHNRWIAEVGDR